MKNVLHVSNISPKWKKHDLEYLFYKYGDCRVDYRVKHAFVDFTREIDAYKC